MCLIKEMSCTTAAGMHAAGESVGTTHEFSTTICFLSSAGLLILRDGAISHNGRHIASDRVIYKLAHKAQ